MENIKQLTINYLNKTNGSGYSQEQISDAMAAIAKAIPHCGALEENIFSLDQEMDANAFKNMMRYATQTKDDSLDKNFQILFDIINANGDGKLSAEELTTMFEDKKDGTVTSWEIWSNLSGVGDLSEFEIQQGALSTPSGSTTSTAGTSSSPSPSTGSASSSPDPSSTNGVQSGQTADSSSQTSGVTVNIDECVAQLYRAMNGLGTDEEALRNILDDPNISDDDFVKIVEAFENKYGLKNFFRHESLVTWVENDTSGKLQSELTEKLAQRLLRAAENGNETAIDVICMETYGGTAGQNGTANAFLKAIFNDKTSSKVISKISERYSVVNKGRNLLKDIKHDYNGFLGIGGLFNSYGKEGDSIIAAINKAARITYN